MSDINPDLPGPKYTRTIVIVQLGTSVTWTRDESKERTIAAIESLFNAGDPENGTGPGGAVLEGLFVRTELGDGLMPLIENWRKDYPLIPPKRVPGELRKKVQDVMDVQGSDGNWDYSPYMCGYFNGMELIRCILDDDEPKFRELPTTPPAKDMVDEQFSNGLADWLKTERDELGEQSEPYKAIDWLLDAARDAAVMGKFPWQVRDAEDDPDEAPGRKIQDVPLPESFTTEGGSLTTEGESLLSGPQILLGDDGQRLPLVDDFVEPNVLRPEGEAWKGMDQKPVIHLDLDPQIVQAVSKFCCAAGLSAYPHPCPWHGGNNPGGYNAPIRN